MRKRAEFFIYSIYGHLKSGTFCGTLLAAPYGCYSQYDRIYSGAAGRQLITASRRATIWDMATKTTKNRKPETDVRYIVNDKGEKTEVVLPVELYEKLLDEIEEMKDIKDFDEAMEKGEWEDFDEVAKRLGL